MEVPASMSRTASTPWSASMRDQQAHDPGAAEVEHAHVEARVPARDVGEVVDQQRVAADVHPASGVPSAELDDAAHHVGQHQVAQARPVPAGAGRDAQPALALRDGDRVPGVEPQRRRRSPARAAARDDCCVVTTGTDRGSRSCATRSKWSPWKCDSSTRSIAGRSSISTAGSVRRVVCRPWPSGTASWRCTKVGSVSTVKPSTRMSRVALPMNSRESSMRRRRRLRRRRR